MLQLKNADEESCEILNSQGHGWRYVHRKYKFHACAADCYWLEQTNLKKKKAEKANKAFVNIAIVQA